MLHFSKLPAGLQSYVNPIRSRFSSVSLLGMQGATVIYWRLIHPQIKKHEDQIRRSSATRRRSAAHDGTAAVVFRKAPASPTGLNCFSNVAQLLVNCGSTAVQLLLNLLLNCCLSVADLLLLLLFHFLHV